jgi:protoporphyrinogen oxidase
MFDYLILGGGVTGVTVGRLLQKRGNNNFLILEGGKEAGGLCRTKNINGHILEIGGGHFLCSVYPEVYDFIYSHIPKSSFNFYERVSKIQLGNTIIDYPIESNLWQLPVDQQAEYLISAVQSGEVIGRKEPKNYEQWIRWKLGNAVADSYMIPYNYKIWGVKPNEMDIDWLNKIPRLNTVEIVKSCLTHFSDKDKFPSHAGFYYPKKGGFQAIFNAIYKHVKNHVQLNEQLKKLTYSNRRWIVNNKYETKKIINTIPWIYVFDAFRTPEKIKKNLNYLKANSIVVSLWEDKYRHNWHWLYIPDINIERHREFYINNFSPESKKGGYFSETNIQRLPKGNKQWSNKRKPIYQHVNQFAYPIAIKGHSKAIKRILEYFGHNNLYGVGRWGQWRYMNMDVCMFEVMKLLKKI